MLEKYRGKCILNNIEEFKRKLWITRKSRIEASERLKKRHDFYQFLIVYYSIIVVIGSILNTQSEYKTNYISLILLILSVTASLFSMFVSSRSHLDRYYNLKNNYIALHNLSMRLNGIENDINTPNDEFSKIIQEYNNLLSSVENHKPIDYLRVINSDLNEKKEDTEKQISKYDNSMKLFNIVLLVAPFLVVLCTILLDLLIRKL